MIWLAALALGGVAAALLTLPWWRPAFAGHTVRRRAANVASYRTRLAELEAETRAGLVEPEAAGELQGELASRLIEDAVQEPAPDATPRRSPRTALLLAALLLAFASAWYGLSDGLRTQQLIELAARDPAAAQAASLDRMIEKLRAEVQRHPGDADHWAWLGRAYRDQEKYEEAAMAFAHARAARSQDDPDLLVDEGEALLYARRGDFSGTPAERFARALEVAPAHPRALWYGGLMALHADDPRRALALWERIPQQELSAEARETVSGSIAELRQRSGLPSQPAPAAAAARVELRLRVTVSPELAASVPQDAALFVFAQTPEGGMPLAVKRLQGVQLPAEITLGDEDSPMPARKLSSVGEWRVVARISRAGGAQAASGDLQGERRIARAQAGKPIAITIDRRIE